VNKGAFMEKKAKRDQVRPIEVRKFIRLDNWSVVNDGDPYKAPEQQESRLHGNAFGHPRFDDGKTITTSAILTKDGDLILTRSGSRYELGDIDPEYEKIYPNARKRLIDSLSV
jgi:hypothetical protein